MSVDWIGRSEGLKLRIRNFVDGRWKEESGDALAKYSPRDGKLLCRFGFGDAKDVDEAVTVARRAFEDGRWSKLPAQRRKDTLQRLASLIEVHREELALLECVDVGKPIADAFNFDVPAAAAIVRHVAEAVDHTYGNVYGVDPSSLSYELRRPLGVVAAIVGWNFPLVLAIQKIAPALVTGNSLVLKPSEFTSLSAARIGELAIEAGVPPGVFNVVHGVGAVGAALGAHHDVDLVTFTGSTQTGKKLLIASGQSNMIALGKAWREGRCEEALKLSIDIQWVEVPPGESRSGHTGSEHCRLSGDWQATKRMQRGSRPRGWSSDNDWTCDSRPSSCRGRQQSAVRYGEGGGRRRSLRPGHAFKAISHEPRRSRYLFVNLGVGSAHYKWNPVPGIRGQAQRKQIALKRSNPWPSASGGHGNG